MNVRKTTLEDRATQPMNQDGLDEQVDSAKKKIAPILRNSTITGMDGNSMVLGDLQLCGDDKHKVV